MTNNNFDHLMPGERQFMRSTAESVEDKLVRYLLGRYKIPKDIKNELHNQARKSTGEATLTCDHFCLRFSTFPVWLACKRIPKIVEKHSVKRLMCSFSTTKLFEAYEDAEDSCGMSEGIPLALVVPWPYMNLQQGVVVHNKSVNHDAPGTRMIWKASDDSTLIIEPFTQLLDNIDADYGRGGWKPE